MAGRVEPYLILELDKSPEDDTLVFDEGSSADGSKHITSSDIAFWGDLAYEETEATLTSDQGSTEANRLYVGNLSYDTTMDHAAPSNGTEVWTLLSSGPLDL
jgi:hypothetical protein